MHEQFARAGVVGNFEPRFLLNHFARSTISTRRQRLSLDMRTALHDANRIAGLCFVLLVVRFELHRLANDLAVHRVRNARLGDDDDRLVHLVGHDAALFDAPRVRRCSVLSCSILSLGDPFFGDDGLNLRVRAAHRADFAEVRQMAGAQRKAKVEEFFLRFFGFLLQLGDRQIAQIFEVVRSSCLCAASSREMIFVADRQFRSRELQRALSRHPARRRKVRTARGPDARRRPRTPDYLYRRPCGLRPASSSPTCRETL